MKNYLFFAIILGAHLYSQPDTLWTRTFGSGVGYCVRQTPDGGYIIAGSGLSGVYLIKTDAQGRILWTKTFGASHRDFGYCVEQTQDGGYIISGTTHLHVSNGWHSDVYLIKTNNQGERLWAKNFGRVGTIFITDDSGYCVQQTTDGGYIIVGTTQFSTLEDKDIYLIKTNAQGDSLWTKTFGGSNDDWSYCVRQTTDGGYIIVGRTSSNVYLIKTNRDGGRLWEKVLRGRVGRWIQQTIDGGYIIVGTILSTGEQGDVYLIKTNSQGDTLWTKRFGGNRDERGYYVQQTTDTGYIIVGETKSYGAGGSDVYLIKTNKRGDTLWTKTFGGSNDDVGYCVQQTADGGYIIVGTKGAEIYLIKLGPEQGVEEVNKQKEIEFNCEIEEDVLVIEYTLPNHMKIKLAMYDIVGNIVKVIEEGEKPSSKYTAYVDTKILKKGIYFIKLQSDNYEKTKKVIKL